MIGDVVNLAARLMQAADDDILCDEATCQLAQSRLAFDALPAVCVKGKSEAVAVYHPSGEAGRRKKATRPHAVMVGRVAEREVLTERLRTLEKGTGGVVVVEGEAGIGKSRLVEDLLDQAESFAVTSMLGWGDAIEQATLYYAWRPVFAQLLDLDLLADTPEAQRKRVMARLEASPELLDLAPLMNAVLPLDLPDNELTAQMRGEARANKTHDLLLQILQEAVSASPLLLVLEDAHWLDSASWALAKLVSRDVQPVLLVLATRPMPDPPPSEYSQLLHDPDLVHLRLGALSPNQALSLVCARLGVTELPGSVADFIRHRTEGHPFFSEELAYALRDSGLITVEDGICRVAPQAGDLRTLRFPDTVQGVIAGRIDRLTPHEQLVLKVASVIGRVFPFCILHDIHPVEADRPCLTDHLSRLEQLDITPLETPEPDLAYIFKHIITQEVAYNLMLFAHRQLLHRTIAEWYERVYVDDLSPYYPLLTHHWSIAGDATKAIDYLEKAGDQALRSGACREAAGFFTRALEMDKEQKTRSERRRRGRWERRLGSALYGLGQFDRAREHLQRALALLGWPLPRTTFGLAVGVLGQLAFQILHRAWPARLVGRMQREKRRCAGGSFGSSETRGDTVL